MKFLSFIILLLISQYSWAEIDDQSFKNTDKYVMLSPKTIGPGDSFNYEIQFVPPKGKKVNQASFVKIWEKIQGKWSLTESLEISQTAEEFFNNSLIHNVLLKSKTSEVALEVDFIYCAYSGGQCDQERYLGKLKHEQKGLNKRAQYELKIKI